VKTHRLQAVIWSTGVRSTNNVVYNVFKNKQTNKIKHHYGSTQHNRNRIHNCKFIDSKI